MRRILATVLVSICLIALSACSAKKQSENYFGFSKTEFTVAEEQDMHGGFHGDGSYYLILDCSNNKETALDIVDGWNKLPLSENIGLIMFGGRKDGTSYGYRLSEEAHLPEVENGYYYFNDRHSMAKDSYDDSALFDRHSFNFSLAVYDSDSNKYYYYEFDT